MTSRRSFSVGVLLSQLFVFCYCQIPTDPNKTVQIQLQVSFAKSSAKTASVDETTKITQMKVLIRDSADRLIKVQDLVPPVEGRIWRAEIELEPALVTVTVEAFEDFAFVPTWRGEVSRVHVQANQPNAVRVELKCLNPQGCDGSPPVDP